MSDDSPASFLAWIAGGGATLAIAATAYKAATVGINSQVKEAFPWVVFLIFLTVGYYQIATKERATDR